MAGITSAIACMALPAIAQSAPAVSDVEIVQTLRDHHARMTVPVTIAAQGPFRFLVDTGAERTVLSRAVAAQLGLVPRETASLVGVAGTLEVPLVDLDEIRLGRRSFYGLSAPLLEQEHIGADGIIGLDSLQGQRVLLDFVNGRLAIDEARQLGGNRGFEIVVTARRRSGQLIVTNASIDGVRTAVIIDTGAEVSIGNPALQRALAGKAPDSPTMLLSVTGQEIMASRGMARRLKMGSITLTNTAIVFAAAPPFEKLGLENKPAILLGMAQLRLFRRVAIDFSTRKILFDLPDASADPIAEPPFPASPPQGWRGGR